MTSRIDKLKNDVTALTGHDPRPTPVSRIKDAVSHAKPDSSRGRLAKHPGQIPAPGWKDVLLRSWQEVSDNNIFLISGGVTYAIVLALFPALAAMVSIYGLLLDPGQVERQMNSLSGLLPGETQQMIGDQLHKLITTSSGSLGISAVVSLLLALWSSSRGMSGLISALNIAYGQKETRNFFKFNMIAVGLTLLMLVGGVAVIALVAVLPLAIQFVGLGGVAKWLLLILEWPLLFAVVIVGLAMLYRLAPNREKAQWRWVSSGAIVATVLWVIGSVLFSLYVGHFNSYDKTYGSLGGVVVMLTWLYLSAFVALFGAVINAQSEQQTQADSTTGPPKPLGSRQASAADTLGEAKI